MTLADVFMTQFSALQTARSVRTRRLAAAEENIEVARAARLAQIFKEICDGIISYKGDRVHPEGFLLLFLYKSCLLPSPETPKIKNNGRSGLGVQEVTSLFLVRV